MALLFTPPYQNALDANGAPTSGGRLRFYVTGTLTPASVYTTSARNVAHASPVVADAAGRWPAIYLDPAVVYRCREFTAADVLVRDTDPYTSLNAGDLIYTPEGAGAVASTIQTKLRMMHVSLTDFGAVGDNVADDSAEIQAAIDANPNYAVLDGKGKAYRIGTSLKIPNGSNFLSIRNARFVAAGDNVMIEGAAGVTPILFFDIDGVLFNSSVGHTTTGRRMVDFSRMASGRITRSRFFGATGKSVAIYLLPPLGTQGYYNTFSELYIGGIATGIMFDDGSGPATGANSNTVRGCRIQPGATNIGVYVGEDTSDISINDCIIESGGGSGIYNAGEATIIQSNRIEGMVAGVAYNGSAKFGIEFGSTLSSNTANRTFAGGAEDYNTIIDDYVLGGYPQHTFAGDMAIKRTLTLGGSLLDFGTAPPVSGTYARGSVRFNSTPSAAGPPGWSCVTAGTPGTWKAMANLAA